MTDANNDRVLGRVEGKLDALIERLDRSEQMAKESRTKMHDRLDTLTANSAKMESRVENMDERLKRVEPVAEDISKWRERGVGVLMFVGTISASVAAAVTAFWHKIVAVFS